MPNLFSKESGIITAHSTSIYGVSGPSWGSSTESCVQPSPMSGSLSLKMAIPQQYFPNTKQLSFQFQDQESSSTQSTGQSSSKEASVKDGNPNGQGIISALPGFNGTHVKPEGGHATLVSSIGPQDFVFTPLHVDYNQSVAPFQLHYAEPYFSGLLSPFLPPQAMIHHSQLMGMAPARVPLPLELAEDEPIYVNAKQYHAILRRRQYRAKLEAQNKLIKGRKPYLHESRHVHAINRARGSGGRFLNSKKLQESKPNPTNNGLDMSESEAHRENYKDGGSTPSCSDITSISNSEDIFQQPEFGFSGYSSHVGSRSMQGCSADINGNGNLHRFLSSVER